MKYTKISGIKCYNIELTAITSDTINTIIWFVLDTDYHNYLIVYHSVNNNQTEGNF